MMRLFSTIIIIVCGAELVIATGKFCGVNEVSSPCANRVCGPRSCSDVDPLPECIMVGHKHCKRGCICRDTYLRADNGTCIPASRCPPNCGENEIPTSCFEARCERRDCSDIPNPVACARIDPRFCTNGCLCEVGFLRATNGRCIPIDRCPEAQCDANEVFDECPSTCPGEECGVDPSLVLCLPSPEPGSPSCQPRCRCVDGYRRNTSNECVPEGQCLNCIGQNEVSGCRRICPPQTCESLEQTFDCRQVGPAICIAECRCRDGFFRNLIGNCISRENCLRCTGPNEYFSCGVACDNVCATLAIQNQTSCTIINIACNEKCYCLPEYARDDNNICVPIQECPPPNTCGPNEVYDECIFPCPSQKCPVDRRLVLCPPNQEGQPGCRCINNYLRNRKGVCVPRDQCEKVKGTPGKHPPKTPKRN